ncbi:MAG: hypothetical protein ACYC3B_02115 [Sedimentisphaerales bacterium]
MTKQNDNSWLTLSGFCQLLVIGLIGLLVPALIGYRHFFTTAERHTTMGFLTGILLAVFAIYLSLTNIYFCFIRPWLYKKKHGNFDGYQNISGIPMVGGITVLFSALLLPSSYLIGLLLLFVYFTDVGGIPCFFYMIIRHELLK